MPASCLFLPQADDDYDVFDGDRHIGYARRDGRDCNHRQRRRESIGQYTCNTANM